MAKKGNRKSEKRLAANKIVPLPRKGHTWHTKPRPGKHNKSKTMALASVLRDLIKISKTAKETRKILNQGDIKVDGRTAKDPKMPIGPFDLVTIQQEKKTYRATINRKGKLSMLEEEFSQNKKICKITGKRATAKNSIQLTTNDGRTLTEKKTNAKVGDSLLIQVPTQEILKTIKEEPGKTAFVIDGKHVGETAKTKGMVEGTMSRPKLITLETKDGQFKTVETNIIIVGGEKPLIKIE